VGYMVLLDSAGEDDGNVWIGFLCLASGHLLDVHCLFAFLHHRVGTSRTSFGDDGRDWASSHARANPW
jgi:hypothetical protein